jgi:predicted Zn-ribbon and HTH transcriptional regulator
MAETRTMKCLRCGHEYPGPYDAKVPIERTCPKCRSNSVRALKPKKATA